MTAPDDSFGYGLDGLAKALREAEAVDRAIKALDGLPLLWEGDQA